MSQNVNRGLVIGLVSMNKSSWVFVCLFFKGRMINSTRWAEEGTWHVESQWAADMRLCLISFLTSTVPGLPGLRVARVRLVREVIPEVPVGASLYPSLAFFSLKMIFPSHSPRMPCILPLSLCYPTPDPGIKTSNGCMAKVQLPPGRCMIHRPLRGFALYGALYLEL